VNRRIVAGVMAGALVLGSLGGLAATAFSGGSAPSSSEDPGEQAAELAAWKAEARAVYDAIAPLTDQAGEAVAQGDDAGYAAANEQMARLLADMPVHPNGEVNALYAAVADAHREIAANADIDGEATIAAQGRVIVLLERVHQIVPAF
jgi:hypothetical protein